MSHEGGPSVPNTGDRTVDDRKCDASVVLIGRESRRPGPEDPHTKAPVTSRVSGVVTGQEDTGGTVVGEEDTVTWDLTGPDVVVCPSSRTPETLTTTPIGLKYGVVETEDTHVVVVVGVLGETVTGLVSEEVHEERRVAPRVNHTQVSKGSAGVEIVSTEPRLVSTGAGLVTPLRSKFGEVDMRSIIPSFSLRRLLYLPFYLEEMVLSTGHLPET